jgi:thiosulfate reductase cytochrome b subunit
MAGSVYVPGMVAARPAPLDRSRHSLLVRVTHWISAVSFIGLVVSGFAIILAHPRFYWGETGGVGGPSLFDLPLPFMLGGPSGWGRYLHFQAAWLCVLNGAIYVSAGVANRHFRRNLVPSDGTWPSLRASLAAQLRFERPRPEEALTYNVVQRLSYLAVVFLLLPLIIWTGLAMSPALTSVFPWLVTLRGGHQTARTVHFFAGVLLVLFVLVHVAMVWRAGFRSRVGAMITGHVPPAKENR